MPFKIFAVEEVLASADVQNYLMRQSVITCTSGTRPASPNEGMTIYETDTDKYMGHDGSTWRELMVINPPAANVSKGSTQSISSGVQTTVSFDNEMYDFRNMWTAGNPTRLVVPSGMGGVYAIGGQLEFSQHGTGSRQAMLLVNGSVVARQAQGNAGSGLATRVNVSREISLSAGDYIELAAFQDSGTSLTLNNTQRMPELWARRVRANT